MESYSPSYFAFGSVDNETKGEVYVDRKLVRPGEAVFVTGFAYLLKKDKPSSVLDNANLQLVISPPFKKGEDKLTIPVEYDTVYGTIHANFTVPLDADIKDYSVALVNKTENRSKQIVSSTITVGDPRPPTATLSVSTPDFVTPEGPLKVSVSAQSFLGASVALAEITV